MLYEKSFEVKETCLKCDHPVVPGSHYCYNCGIEFASRIGWLDSANLPSHIHKTFDEGKTTLCGHKPKDEKHWKITDEIPRKIQGRSNYCLICFEKGKKSLPFIQK